MPAFLFIGSSENFRKSVASKAYKGNRPDKPAHYYTNREYLLSCGAITVSGVEVDDAIATYGVRYPEGVVASADKDLTGVTGINLYNLRTRTLRRIEDRILTYQVPKIKLNAFKIPEVTYQEVIEFQGGYFTLYQMLVGDSTDHIAGVRGIGEKTATKLLKNAKSLNEGWGIVYNEYRKLYGENAQAHFTESYLLLKIISNVRLPELY